MRTITVNKWSKGEYNKEKVTLPSGLLLLCLSGGDLSFCASPASALSFVLRAERAHPYLLILLFPLSLESMRYA